MYVNFVDYTKSPRSFAQYYLIYNIGQKTYYTNYGINFFLYVISGQKFRSDLMNLFKLNTNEIRPSVWYPKQQILLEFLQLETPKLENSGVIYVNYLIFLARFSQNFSNSRWEKWATFIIVKKNNSFMFQNIWCKFKFSKHYDR